jgi:hypothetical protein
MAIARGEFGKEDFSMKTLRALFWGCVTGAALAYVFAPRRIDLLRGAYGRVSGRSGATTTKTTNATNASSETTNTLTAGALHSPSNMSGGAATTQAPHASTLAAVNGQTATADNAAYIGNTHTQVYHSATDSNLPNEENRAYFLTAEDAEAAGYRAAGLTTQV